MPSVVAAAVPTMLYTVGCGNWLIAAADPCKEPLLLLVLVDHACLGWCHPTCPVLAMAHIQGLKRQVEELIAVSHAECNLRRWAPPTVVLFFPDDVDPHVANALRELGAHVAVGPGEV